MVSMYFLKKEYVSYSVYFFRKHVGIQQDWERSHSKKDCFPFNNDIRRDSIFIYNFILSRNKTSFSVFLFVCLCIYIQLIKARNKHSTGRKNVSFCVLSLTA